GREHPGRDWHGLGFEAGGHEREPFRNKGQRVYRVQQAQGNAHPRQEQLGTAAQADAPCALCHRPHAAGGTRPTTKAAHHATDIV
ncbi:MAG: hypothetical protein ABI988_06335, partial [Nitrospirota bacterium]